MAYSFENSVPKGQTRGMENCYHPIQGSLSVHLPTVIIENLHTIYPEITMNTSIDGVLCLLRVIQFILGASKLLSIYILMPVCVGCLCYILVFSCFLTFTCKVACFHMTHYLIGMVH